MRTTLSLLCASAILIASNSAFAAKKDIVDTAVKAGSFKTLVAAVKAAGLVDALKGAGPLTVFAPTDEAFAKLPKGTVEMLLKPENKQKLVAILTYHVVSGKVKAKHVVKLTNAKTLNGQQVDISVKKHGDAATVMIDQAKVIKADIACSNGVIHVIDQVIIPSDNDIVDTAVSAGSFKTLVAAAKAAGLVETLKGKGPFTVFAPTDEAFAKLPKGTVESLLLPENKSKLQAILTYHVVPGRVFASDVVKLSSAKTVQGGNISITVDNGVRVNKSNVLKTDIDASNGVIHVIDSVLLPPADKKAARAHARQMLQAAVTRGSKLYNAGHSKMCADLYSTAAKQLMQISNLEMGECVTNRLQTAMKECESTHCNETRAWTMRKALDHAYISIQ